MMIGNGSDNIYNDSFERAVARDRKANAALAKLIKLIDDKEYATTFDSVEEYRLILLGVAKELKENL